MEIRSPQITSINKKIRFQAEVAYSDSWKDELIWFEFDERYLPYITLSANPWLVLLTPLAFNIGEKLQINQFVDPVLLSNMNKIMQILKHWYPKKSLISIEAKELKPETPMSIDKSALFFTGGIDSFYTVLRNDSLQNNIDYLVSVFGFDFPIVNYHVIQDFPKKLYSIGEDLKKEIILINTNLKESRFKTLKWTVNYGFALSSTVFIFEKLFTKILIAASGKKEDYEASLWGDSPEMVPLYSSSTKYFYLDSLGVDRISKIEYISKSKLMLDNLKVCNVAVIDYNCSKCEKCYRTMVSLELINRLNQCSTFDLKSFNLKNIQKIFLKTKHSLDFWIEIKKYAEKNNRNDLVKLINKSLANTKRIKTFYLPFIGKLKKSKICFKFACFLDDLIMQKIIK